MSSWNNGHGHVQLQHIQATSLGLPLWAQWGATELPGPLFRILLTDSAHSPKLQSMACISSGRDQSCPVLQGLDAKSSDPLCSPGYGLFHPLSGWTWVLIIVKKYSFSCDHQEAPTSQRWPQASVPAIRNLGSTSAWLISLPSEIKEQTGWVQGLN